MRKYAIILLLLLHGLYLTSPFFVSIAFPAEGVREYIYLALSVSAYALSFFELGKLKYLVLTIYAHLAYRCAAALPSSFSAGVDSYFILCVLALITLLFLGWHMVFRRGLPVPEGWMKRIMLTCWVVTLALVSRASVMLVTAFDANLISVGYAAVFLLAFLSTAAVRAGSGWIMGMRLAALSIFSIPYLLSMPMGDDPVFSSRYIYVSMSMLGVTFVLLLTVWAHDKRGRRA